jgi:DNA helicase HerA-like ATPase
MIAEDRMRHFYVIGQTGTGKTGGLVSMIAQDIANGDGVCFIDPHGNDVQTHYVDDSRSSASKDVIYFDPTYYAATHGAQYAGV